MTPETGEFLAKARELLEEAEAVLAVKRYNAAGRAAYLAFRQLDRLAGGRNARRPPNGEARSVSGLQVMSSSTSHSSPSRFGRMNSESFPAGQKQR